MENWYLGKLVPRKIHTGKIGTQRVLYGVPPQWQDKVPFATEMVPHRRRLGFNYSLLCLMHIELRFVSKLVTENW
jgi:hypothetical protein